MKLATYRLNNQLFWGVVSDGVLREVARVNPSLPQRLKEVIRDWDQLATAVSHAVDSSPEVALDQVEFSAPIPEPDKILCIGRNYSEHALEQGAEVPTEPIVFSKFPTALTGHNTPIRIPAQAEQVDYEGELVVVIGKEGRNIPEEQALNHLFGSTCGNDVTARDWQKGRPGGQWLLGKSIESFGPIGPWIVTADEADPEKHRQVRTTLNGQVVQDGNTSQFLFSLSFLISHLSKFFTLKPGDLLFTGTPEGVGIARTPPLLLKKGDQIEVEIEGVGALTNSVQNL